ncbi:MAG: aminopeptidase [Christensenellaceae bacterium]|jgi:aspartyl aminopeptidase|nr:aminopeptidase [Christensenellaceae bacterium]
MANSVTKSEAKEKDLEYNEKFVTEVVDQQYIDRAMKFCEGYKDFLNNAKTEREGVKTIRALADKAGFREWDRKGKLTAGERVYFVNRKKTIVLISMGSEDIEKGVNMTVAHLDSPRLDLKTKPLYEDGGMGYLKTHYYGAIKNYQWTTIPLALHGVIIKKDGSSVDVKIGEDKYDPVFCITDLLPHLSRKQDEKKMKEGIEPEGLNILIGSIPLKGSDKDKPGSVKKNILEILNKKYGVVEQDLVTAELEIVPAVEAKDIGFDRSMVGAYGQDDRICVYPTLQAILNLKGNQKTSVVVLADKEEIGFCGITAPTPLFLRGIIEQLAMGKDLRLTLENSACLSSDVNAAFDPLYADVFESRNSTYLGKGLAICKYTGYAWKAGASDASAEFLSRFTRLFDKHNIVWQTGEIGKAGAGGGGTFATEIAAAGIEVLDAGVAILSMHSPFEIASKLDIYSFYQGCEVFLKDF